jgi:hypothetical protein
MVLGHWKRLCNYKALHFLTRKFSPPVGDGYPATFGLMNKRRVIGDDW